LSAAWGDTQTGSNRVNRGGSWNNNPANVRSANRNRNGAANRNANLGFRLVSPAHRVVDAGGEPGVILTL